MMCNYRLKMGRKSCFGKIKVGKDLQNSAFYYLQTAATPCFRAFRGFKTRLYQQLRSFFNKRVIFPRQLLLSEKQPPYF